MSIQKKVFLALVVVAALVGCQTGGNTEKRSEFVNDTIRVVTWNMETIFSPDMAIDRLDDLKKLYAEQSPDILLVQEITAKKTLDKIKDLLGLEDYQTAISDFSEDGQKYKSLEVGVISRYPLDGIVEFDPIPDGKPANEKQIVPLSEYGIKKAKVYRGIFSFRIKGTDFHLYNVHLKSSRGKVGQDDFSNAQKREMVMAYLAKNIADSSKSNPEATFLVAGDFNVGHSDEKKNGEDLSVDSLDFNTCKGADLYDDTHALLANGLIDGLKMKNLCKHIMQSSYPAYSGTPIDNILVYGKYANGFEEAGRAKETYGSDHTPMYTSLVIPVDRKLVLPAEKVKVLPPEPLNPSVKIFAVLANPKGDEKQDEKVVLKNISEHSINLEGWVLKDKANTEWSLNGVGNIAPGEEKTIRRNGQEMSLNNTNEKIRLIDKKGKLIDKIFYIKAREEELLTF